MSWYDDMMADMLRWIQRSVDADATQIQSFESSQEWVGACDTCSYELEIVEVNFLDATGKNKDYTYYGALDDFLKELLRDDA